MGLVSRALEVFGIRKEGEYHEGPYFLPWSGGWLPAGSAWNFWQQGYDVRPFSTTAMVEACVSAYAQTLAMCPGNHWKWTPAGGRERVINSALVRVIRKPNSYQTVSDFLMNLVRSLLLEGNAYALAIRNNRFEVQEFHLMDPRASHPQLAEDGSIFYSLGGNEVIEQTLPGSFVVPQRDVLHIRMHTPRHPLVGETPLMAAALQLAASNAVLNQQIQFFLNQAKPSFLLSTDKPLSLLEARQLRLLWDEQAKGVNQGGTAVLTGGLKAQQIAATAKDTQLVDLLQLTEEAIADVFRIPMQVLGKGDATPYASTEALMQYWKAGGLGFILNHVEEAIGNFFGLSGQPDEYLEFDTNALMRSAFKDRVEAWSAGTKGGIFARNEARQDFELAHVEYGDEPWVQQQDIPLSVAGENAENPPEPPAPPAPPPAAEPEEEPEGETEDERGFEDYSRGIRNWVHRETVQGVH